jgi:hypothetical protein
MLENMPPDAGFQKRAPFSTLIQGLLLEGEDTDRYSVNI